MNRSWGGGRPRYIPLCIGRRSMTADQECFFEVSRTSGGRSFFVRCWRADKPGAGSSSPFFFFFTLGSRRASKQEDFVRHISTGCVHVIPCVR